MIALPDFAASDSRHTPPSGAQEALVRYGALAEVARVAVDDSLLVRRGDRVVVRTRRGLELGQVVDSVRLATVSPIRPAISSDPQADDSAAEPIPAAAEPIAPGIVRLADPEDLSLHAERQARAASEFDLWSQRIVEWGLNLELLDVEWLLDGSKLIAYVLTGRGAETTRFALQAATLGVSIDVQPMQSDGAAPTGGGCGDCGCGAS